MRRAPVALLALAVLAGGCFGSKPTRLYMLSSVAGDLPGIVDARGESRVIAVGPVSIPDYIDRPQIVVREDANQVKLAGFDQWAGSLADMVGRVLVEDLRTQMPADHVVPFPQAGASAFDYRVAVQLTRFDVSTADEAVATATWRVWDRAGARTRLTAGTTTRAQAAGATYQERVAALSQALADLAGEIARSLARLEPHAMPR